VRQGSSIPSTSRLRAKIMPQPCSRTAPHDRESRAMAAFLSFSSGAVAQLTYSGYDRFDSDEFHWWIGENGNERVLAEMDLRAEPYERRPSPVASEKCASRWDTADAAWADLRPSTDGVLVYDDTGVREVRTTTPRVDPSKDGVIDEFYRTASEGVRPYTMARGRPRRCAWSWHSLSLVPAAARTGSPRLDRARPSDRTFAARSRCSPGSRPNAGFIKRGTYECPSCPPFDAFGL
jgi:hypothetical protein